MLPSEIYTISSEGKMAGFVTARHSKVVLPKSHVFAFQNKSDAQVARRFLSNHHWVIRRNAKDVLVKSEPPPRTQKPYSLQITKEDTLDVVTYALINNTRVFLVSKLVQPDEETLRMLSMFNPDSLRIDQDAIVQNLNNIIELDI